jgi:GR25 family glycosyltransferase involved in LPS biosynthesis
MVNMDLIYINLESAKDRDEEFLRSFQQAGFSGDWTITRLNAVNKNSDEVKNTPGIAADSLKGNYLSHVKCLELSISSGNHVFIAEDDTHFSKMTQHWLNTVIGSLAEDTWDVILADVYISDATDMPKLLKTRRRYLRDGALSVVNVSVWPIAFVGAGAYIVNKRSKEKLLNAVRPMSVDCAYDLILREVLRTQKLTGLVTLPFLTTISETGDDSQVQGDDRMLEVMLYHAFRRLFWIGAEDAPAIQKRCELMGKDTHDAEVDALCELMKPLLSIQMSWA